MATTVMYIQYTGQKSVTPIQKIVKSKILSKNQIALRFQAMPIVGVLLSPSHSGHKRSWVIKY